LVSVSGGIRVVDLLLGVLSILPSAHPHARCGTAESVVSLVRAARRALATRGVDRVYAAFTDLEPTF
jgi:hypothetical protein